MQKTNWKAVVTFYFLACLWSWPFFWWRDVHPESWKALELPRNLKNWTYMWGPGIAALICFYLFRSSHQRIMTFKGTSLKHGLGFFIILPVALSALNLEPKYLWIGVVGFISILGEELGWRGFLQDALKIESDYLKALVIGSMWEIWHFTNRTLQPGAVIRVLIWIGVTSVLSFIFIKLTKKTNSLFIPVALHMAFNAAFEFDNGWQAVLISVPFWAVIYWDWLKIPSSTSVHEKVLSAGHPGRPT